MCKYHIKKSFDGMIFELHRLNIIAMKKIAFLFLIVLLFSDCSSTKELASTKAENRKSRRLAEQAAVKKAVESRKFIIRVNRLYSTGGSIWELIPTSNFIVINGEIASISLGYMGRSFGIHQISGINLNGHTLNYKMESNEAKGIYNIQMVVKYGADKFEVYLTIGNNGSCNISLNNAYIQSVSYSGSLVPLPDSKYGSLDKKSNL
jgi:hypothetical protein